MIIATVSFLAAVSSVVIRPGAVSVVVEENASPVVRFAATELTNGLAHTFGTAVPIVHAPREGETSILLGTNRWSRAEGLDPEPLVRDGFLVADHSPQLIVDGGFDTIMRVFYER